MEKPEFVVFGFSLLFVHARLRCGDAARIMKQPLVISETFETEHHATWHSEALTGLDTVFRGICHGIVKQKFGTRSDHSTRLWPPSRTRQCVVQDVELQ